MVAVTAPTIPEDEQARKQFKELNVTINRRPVKVIEKVEVKNAAPNPGTINSSEQVQRLCIVTKSSCDKFLYFNDDPYNNLILRPESEV